MKIVIIGSGSKGNSTYIETKNAKILIDAGLSLLQVKNRLLFEGITLDTLDAVFVTHEHTDHIGNLVQILTKTHATLYINEVTYQNANKKLKNGLVHFEKVFIDAEIKYELKDIAVVPILLSHDTPVCYGYLVKELFTEENNTFASITDTGFIPTKYYKILSTIAVLLVESNHDVKMLMNSGRPWMLIDRILSNNGHMSNQQCCDHLKQIVSNYTKKVILAHISEECNDYELARSFFIKEFGKEITFDLSIAYQYTPHQIIELGGERVA